MAVEEHEILKRAQEVSRGHRRKVYGHPKENHGCTAALWSAYLNRKFAIKVELDGRDVCWLNILQKASRDAFSHELDNLVDTAGYAANAGECS